MERLTSLTLLVSLLLATPCIGQEQLAYPINPQSGGFPAGHPGIPVLAGPNKQWTPAELHEGDSVLLEMRGRPAVAYLKLFVHDVPEGAGTSLEARVLKMHADSIVAESRVMLPSNPDRTQFVTVTTTLRRDALQAPSGYSAPIRPEMNDIERQGHDQRMRQARLPQIRIDSLEQTRIRIWALEREVAE